MRRLNHHHTHMVRFPDGSHTDTTDIEFNELFEETFLPRGLKTTKASYHNRNDDGSPALVHAVTGNPYLAPVASSTESDSDFDVADRSYEVKRVRKVHFNKETAPYTPEPFSQSPVLRDSASPGEYGGGILPVILCLQTRV